MGEQGRGGGVAAATCRPRGGNEGSGGERSGAGGEGQGRKEEGMEGRVVSGTLSAVLRCAAHASCGAVDARGRGRTAGMVLGG